MDLFPYRLSTGNFPAFGPWEVDEILATVRHDITAVETNLEEPTVGSQPAARLGWPWRMFFC